VGACAWRLGVMLRFPNHSRAYDATRRAVRFWGYDSAMESSFFITEDALRQLHRGTCWDEQQILLAFDSNRNLILAAAAKIYGQGRKGSYELGPAAFPGVAA
jgi:hypothetical protein